MDYVKNLTLKQWIIIVTIELFFIVAYFFFPRKAPQQTTLDLERLLEQSRAPVSVEENISKADLKRLLQQDTPASGGGSSTELTPEQKNDLFRLMNAPK
jgi:hypothetical protein